MLHNARLWDEMEETGLRLCAENSGSGACLPSEVTACSWDPNNPGVLGLCGADGSFVLARHESETAIASSHYAVYFSTLPVHLWGRRVGDPGHNSSPALAPAPAASAPARRVSQPWSQVSFVPGRPGDVVFVQGWSPRVLLSSLPKLEARRAGLLAPSDQAAAPAAGGRFGLVTGSRVVALDGHQAQVQCLAIDAQGSLLLTGDESGTLCARLLNRRHGDGDTNTRTTQYRNRVLGSKVTPDGPDGHSCVKVEGAHEGGILAMTHVEGKLRGEEGEAGGGFALFVSGGIGGVVRLWRATVLEGTDTGSDSETELHIQLLTDMLVGGFQVSCLAASMSYEAPLVLAGTAEGTVFAFAVSDPSRDGFPQGVAGGGKGFSTMSGVSVGKAGLGRVLMKFEHTRRCIDSISCSRYQELIAAADAEGIVRTYRPVSSKRLPHTGGELQPLQNSSTANAATTRPFELIVECRLGARSAVCEFAVQAEAGGPEHRQPHGREEEVLRTCTRDSSLRVWPADSLPTRPLRPPPAELPMPPPLASRNAGSSSNTLAAVEDEGDIDDDGDQENRDPCRPNARPEDGLHDCRAEQKDEVGAGGGHRESDGDGSRGGENGVGGEQGGAPGEEGPTARRKTPIPRGRPAAPRHVSFAPAEQVFKLYEPYYDTGSRWTQDREDEEHAAPRPPPPAPTPSPHSARLRRSGQARGGAPRGGGGGGGGGRKTSADTTTEGGDSDVFVTPSRLQEASMWSTAMEQAALERRMREEFDADTAQEPPEPASRASAATAVNIHPLARTFEGLVSVSIDAPPPRHKRKGKQVSKAHLSKVEERRITDEDLVFDDMEPACSSIAAFDHSRLWPRAELEWYGGLAATADLEDASMISDRVWSWGVR